MALGAACGRILLLLLGVALAAPLLSLVIAEARVGRTLERRFYDNWFSFRGPLPRPTDVVLVPIDVESEQSLGRYPWTRDWHAKLVENLARAGASVVAFDATFADAFPAQDSILRRVIDETGVTVLGAKSNVIFTRNAQGVSLEEPAGDLRGAPIGIVDISPDATDDIIREYPIVHEYPQGRVPQLGVKAALLHLGLPDQALQTTPTGWRIGEREIPRGPGGGMLVNFLGTAGSVSSYSYAYVVDDAYTDIGDWDLDTYEDFLADSTFQDKVVLIGSTIPEDQDLHATPFREVAGSAGAVRTAGVEIHAHAVATILSGAHLRQVSRPIQYAWTLLLALLVTSLAPKARALWGAGVALAISGVALYAAWYLFTREGLWLWSVAPLLSVGFSYAGSNVALYVAEEQEKARIRGMFQQYVASSVVDELIEKPELLSLGGEERVLTVLFSDVAGFSTISEGLTPKALVELLNEYLTAMTDIILEEGGIIDKYEGDLIMAEFGAPVPLDDHPVRACRAALRMRTELERLREKWKEEGKPLLEARVGINTGEMLVGNLGSHRVMDYTVMGDQVNLASRLEGTNKVYGTEVIVSEFTWEAVKDHMVGRELDLIRVKGKNEPVRIFEILAARSNGAPPDLSDLLERFSQGLGLYVERRFEEARASFEALARDYPEDGPTALYMERCAEYAQSPPPADWDGVYTMKTK